MARFPSLISTPAINPFSEEIEFKNLRSTFDNDMGSQQVKQKRLYQRRNLSLKYNYITKAEALTLWAFFIARKGSVEEFNTFYPISNTYVKEFVVVCDGTSTVFNCPCETGTSVAFYLNDVLLTVTTDYTYTQGAGTDQADQVTLIVAGGDGLHLTQSFTGYLKVRSQFADDSMSFDTFYDRLVSFGLKIRGLTNA